MTSRHSRAACALGGLTALAGAALIASAAGPVLTSVWTTNGARDWVWYGGDGDQLVDAINRALAGHERLPIELMIEADPAWEQYKDLLASAE